MYSQRPRISPSPDFARFADVLLLRSAVARPPLFDFHIDAGHMSRALGADVRTDAAAWAEAYRVLGYDFVQCSFCAPMAELWEAERVQRAATGATSHSAAGIITSRAHFHSRAWSWQPVAEGDLTPLASQFQRLEQVVAALPAGMNVLLHTADIFTFAWELLGFDAFCLASYEDPELIDDLMNSIEAAQFAAVRAALRLAGDRAGALLYSDDIAYTEGLMLSPGFYRRTLFPRIARLAEMAGTVPLIYHSDGRLYQVFDDLHAAGVRAIQPLEPKSMDPVEIKRRWPGHFCLLGNIDLDLMSRGSADAVEAHVREKIARLNVGGGYMPGVSNTVPAYVNYENYLRMIEVVYSYGS